MKFTLKDYQADAVDDVLANLKRGFFPMEDAWCMGKYGRCEFFEVCTAEPAQREAMLASGLYTDNLHRISRT